MHILRILQGSTMTILGASHVPRSDLSANVFGDNEFEEYLGVKWQRVTSEINWVGNENKLWVSLGSSLKREKLYFAEDSPLIQTLKVKALSLCRGRALIDVLNIVNELINSLTAINGEDYLVTDARLEPALEQLLNTKVTSLQQVVSIHMDELIQRRILICRHKGLLASAILGFLVEQKVLPSGSVRQYRSTIIKNNRITAHTWSVYREHSTGQIWICDPRWRIAQNVNVNFHTLAQLYTNEVLLVMLQRLDAEDVYFPLLESIEDHAAGLPFTVEAFQHEQPGLMLCFRFQNGDKALAAFSQALTQQSIQSFENESSLYVSISDNPAIVNLNFDKLIQAFDTLHKLFSVPLNPSSFLQSVFTPVKAVLFSVSTTSVQSLPPGRAITFKNVDWEELNALECLPEEKEFVTSGGLFGRFAYKPL